MRPQGLSLTRVITTVARCRPASLSRRRIASTSPARPRRRISTAPMSSSRRRRANCRSFHGADSSTRRVRAKGVVTARSRVRKAICGSILAAPPSSRARSSTRVARVTAGFGSSRYSPGWRSGTGSPGRAVRLTAPRPGSSTVARRRPAPAAAGAVARAGDHSTASLRSRASAMNSASHPGGMNSSGMPGAALTQTAGTWLASPAHQSRAGSDWPGRNRRAVPAVEPPGPADAWPGPARRAGSMNTASSPRPASNRSRTSATSDVTRPARP
jgi:hypothetical protein